MVFVRRQSSFLTSHFLQFQNRLANSDENCRLKRHQRRDDRIVERAAACNRFVWYRYASCNMSETTGSRLCLQGLLFDRRSLFREFDLQLVAVSGQPKIKLSEDVSKITIPGRKRCYRLISRTGYSIVDLMMVSDN